MTAPEVYGTGGLWALGLLLGVVNYSHYYGPRVGLNLGRIDFSYCIDAPESLPAGACEWYQCADDLGLPAQLEFSRETP